MRKLVLFDIDGTLLRAYGAGGRAMRRAAEQVLGERCRGAQVEFGGALDPWIFGQLALHGGYEVTPAVHAAFRALYADCSPRSWRSRGTLPGDARRARRARPAARRTAGHARAADRQLRRDRGAQAARRRHRSALVRDRGVGDLANERHALVPVALAQLPYVLETKHVIIVGDTARDVHCARVNGCACLAVATGGSSARELADAGADVVLEDLRDASHSGAYSTLESIHDSRRHARDPLRRGGLRASRSLTPRRAAGARTRACRRRRRPRLRVFAGVLVGSGVELSGGRQRGTSTGASSTDCAWRARFPRRSSHLARRDLRGVDQDIGLGCAAARPARARRGAGRGTTPFWALPAETQARFRAARRRRWTRPSDGTALAAFVCRFTRESRHLARSTASSSSARTVDWSCCARAAPNRRWSRAGAQRAPARAEHEQCHCGRGCGQARPGGQRVSSGRCSRALAARPRARSSAWSSSALST